MRVILRGKHLKLLIHFVWITWSKFIIWWLINCLLLPQVYDLQYLLVLNTIFFKWISWAQQASIMGSFFNQLLRVIRLILILWNEHRTGSIVFGLIELVFRFLLLDQRKPLFAYGLKLILLSVLVQHHWWVVFSEFFQTWQSFPSLICLIIFIKGRFNGFQGLLLLS